MVWTLSIYSWTNELSSDRARSSARNCPTFDMFVFKNSWISDPKVDAHDYNKKHKRGFHSKVLINAKRETYDLSIAQREYSEFTLPKLRTSSFTNWSGIRVQIMNSVSLYVLMYGSICCRHRWNFFSSSFCMNLSENWIWLDSLVEFESTGAETLNVRVKDNDDCNECRALVMVRL